MRGCWILYDRRKREICSATRRLTHNLIGGRSSCVFACDVEKKEKENLYNWFLKFDIEQTQLILEISGIKKSYQRGICSFSSCPPATSSCSIKRTKGQTCLNPTLYLGVLTHSKEAVDTSFLSSKPENTNTLISLKFHSFKAEALNTKITDLEWTTYEGKMCDISNWKQTLFRKSVPSVQT